MTQIRFSGTTHSLALSDIEPVSVTAMLGGYQALLDVPDDETYEAWISRICEVACDLAGEGHKDQAEQLYKDIERADKLMGKGVVST